MLGSSNVLQNNCSLAVYCFCRPKPLLSTFNYQAHSFKRPLSEVLLTDFFGDRKRVATRRHKAAQPQPQCMKHTHHVNVSSSGWQTPAPVPSGAKQMHSLEQLENTQRQQLYTGSHCLISEDQILLVLFAALAAGICSLLGRHWDTRMKQCHLVC